MESINTSAYSAISAELIKSSMMQNLNARILNSAIDAGSELINSFSSGDYQMDDEIPENSTVSFHV